MRRQDKLTFLDKKSEALKEVKRKMGESELTYFYAIQNYLEMAIDEFVMVDSGKRCRCGEPLPKRNRSGLCRTCYKEVYWRNPEHIQKMHLNSRKHYVKKKTIVLAK